MLCKQTGRDKSKWCPRNENNFTETPKNIKANNFVSAWKNLATVSPSDAMTSSSNEAVSSEKLLKRQKKTSYFDVKLNFLFTAEPFLLKQNDTLL